MKRYRILRLSGRCYTIFSPTPLTAKRVITALRDVQISELGDVPDGAQLCARAISFAITGSGFFSRLRAFHVRRRLLRWATLDELVEGLQVVVEMIPANEFYTISLVTNQFNKLVSR